jgi:flagellar basal body-associated protein FliL
MSSLNAKKQRRDPQITEEHTMATFLIVLAAVSLVVVAVQFSCLFASQDKKSEACAAPNAYIKA